MRPVDGALTAVRRGQITGPDGQSIYSSQRETDGRYTFSASVDGLHEYCFSNKMSTLTPKTILFSVEVVPPRLANEATDPAAVAFARAAAAIEASGGNEKGSRGCVAHVRPDACA